MKYQDIDVLYKQIVASAATQDVLLKLQDRRDVIEARVTESEAEEEQKVEDLKIIDSMAQHQQHLMLQLHKAADTVIKPKRPDIDLTKFRKLNKD